MLPNLAGWVILAWKEGHCMCGQLAQGTRLVTTAKCCWVLPSREATRVPTTRSRLQCVMEHTQDEHRPCPLLAGGRAQGSLFPAVCPSH